MLGREEANKFVELLRKKLSKIIKKLSVSGRGWIMANEKNDKTNNLPLPFKH